MNLVFEIDRKRLVDAGTGAQVSSLQFSYPDKYPLSISVEKGNQPFVFSGNVYITLKPASTPLSAPLALLTIPVNSSSTVSGVLDTYIQEMDDWLPPANKRAAAFEVLVVATSVSTEVSVNVPAQISRRYNSVDQPGVTVAEKSLATQAEAESGVNNTKWMSPLRVSQAIAARSSGLDDTDDLSEGSTNLYFTEQRAKEALADELSEIGSDITELTGKTGQLETDLSAETTARLDADEALQAQVTSKSPTTLFFALAGATEAEFNTTYRFTGEFSGDRPVYRAQGGQWLAYESADGGSWELFNAAGARQYWHLGDAYDPAILVGGWKRGSGQGIPHQLSITPIGAVPNVHGNASDPVARAAIELRTEESLGDVALKYAVENDSWQVHDPDNFRTAIDAAPTENPTFMGTASVTDGGDLLTLSSARIQSTYNEGLLDFEESRLAANGGNVLNWDSGQLSVENRTLKNLGAPIDANDAVRKVDISGSKNLTAPIEVKAVTQGAYSDGTTIPAGTPVEEILRKMLQTRVPATYAAPTLSISANFATQAEIGSSYSGTIVPTWTQRDAGAATLTSLVLNGAQFASATGAPASSYSIPNRTLTAAESWQLDTFYSAGPQKLDNFGDPSGTPIPGGRAYSNTLTITPVRRIFLGASTDTSAPTTSAHIRALLSTLAPANGSTYTLTLPAGTRRAVIAYPATLRAISSVKYVELGNAEVKDTFTETSVQVDGATAGQNATAYRVYTYISSIPLGSAATYTITI